MIAKSILRGAAGASLLLIFYFSILTLVSGWDFTLIKFAQNWYWIIGLSMGFGIQVGLFFWLRALSSQKISGKTVAVSGGTSGVAMIACCSHYLVNLMPVIGITAFAAIIGQYQTELFFLGLVSNILGITYMISRLIKFKNVK